MIRCNKIKVGEGKLEERWGRQREKWREQRARERAFLGRINRDRD